MININTKPTYYASLQLACGLTAVIQMVNDQILFATQDGDGIPRIATITSREAGEVASMLSAAHLLERLSHE